MPNRLADAVSPYLRSHAGNPVDWWAWGEDAFREAEARDVPVFVSIGYATCHWCHVMARESFEDPQLAAYLNEHFVPIKVDREEHPEVDASFLTAAGAFTRQLGWPLSVFTTPTGRTFYAGTYFPPTPHPQRSSFREVLEAVVAAWTERRADVDATADSLGAAIAAGRPARPPGESMPGDDELAAAVERLAGLEDPEFGGFGGAPKFPVAPVLRFLAERGARGDGAAHELVRRTLARMAESSLRDPIEGGFFRYATGRDWTEPHYERMLYDNAQLLDVATALGEPGREVADGIGRFLVDVLRLPSGAFASAQDSESDLDGVRSEGGYYKLDAASRARQPRPALDEKVLAGLNGLAIGALADAGVRFDRPEWVDAAAGAADEVLRVHSVDGRLARASRDGRVSDAVATLEDHGALAAGLMRLGLARGEVSYAMRAREFVDACVADDGTIGVPGGADPVLAARGLVVEESMQEGAQPSGASLLADAALRLEAVTGAARYREVAERAIAPVATLAPMEPLAFGGVLTILGRLAGPHEQLVVVTPEGRDADPDLVAAARAWGRPAGTLAIVGAATAHRFADEGFELFAERSTRDGRTTAYLCRSFVCALPATDASTLTAQLA